MIGEPDLKILVLSDSHRAIGAMYDAAILEDPDAIMHLGDHVSDAEELSYALDLIDFYMVRGNCDFGAQAPETILTELGGVRLFLTHGHLFGVKSGMSRLKLEADRVGADIAPHAPAVSGRGRRRMVHEPRRGQGWALRRDRNERRRFYMRTEGAAGIKNNCRAAVLEESYAVSD